MPQIYEEYWKLTLAWTNFNDMQFINALKGTIEFIDDNVNIQYTPNLYRRLQNKLRPILGLDDASLRKGINQLVKLGFVSYHLSSYHTLAKEYIKTTLSDKDRQMLLSKIMYSNSSFNKSVTHDSSKREINFFIKTLEECVFLDESLLGALMTIDTNEHPEGFIDKRSLEYLLSTQDVQNFISRKYNQISYLSNILKKLDGIAYKENRFYLEKDTDKIQIVTEIKGRDPYLQRIYKKQLQKETLDIFGRAKCMVEKLEYPVLIASHIKPFKCSNDSEAFDPNNGLLLSRTLDSLFDLNYISFADDGHIIFYNRVPDDVKQFWQTYKLDARFINPERLGYLAYHRQLCESKNSL